MIGPLFCSFFSAADLARSISTHGPRTYVFEVSENDQEYYPEGEVVYYLAHAESYSKNLSSPTRDVKTMGMAMDGVWKNFQEVRDHKNMCEKFASDLLNGFEE